MEIRSENLQDYMAKEENGIPSELYVSGATRGGVIFEGRFYWCARGLWSVAINKGETK